MTWKAFNYYGNQEELMRFTFNTLRPVIRQFEEKKWIKGFNFSFYSGEDTHLGLRLDLRKKYEREIMRELHKLSLTPQESTYSERDKIAKYYELGSRWSFLLQDQIDKRRFQKEWMNEDNFVLTLHGLCNSLFYGYYKEIRVYLTAIGMIGLTLGKFDEIKNDLKQLDQKCKQWFIKSNTK